MFAQQMINTTRGRAALRSYLPHLPAEKTLREAPRQYNTDAEKAALREGRIPAEWAARPKKLAQKDRDTRWTLKRAKARRVKTVNRRPIWTRDWSAPLGVDDFQAED